MGAACCFNSVLAFQQCLTLEESSFYFALKLLKKTKIYKFNAYF